MYGCVNKSKILCAKFNPLKFYPFIFNAFFLSLVNESGFFFSLLSSALMPASQIGSDFAFKDYTVLCH